MSSTMEFESKTAKEQEPDRKTETLPQQITDLLKQSVPRHVAIIMDGNGRWAEAKGQPRVIGHKAGVKAVRRTVSTARELGIKSLTLFAFSSENWRRPEKEVGLLMELFFTVLQREIKQLHKNGVKLNIIGDTSRFSRRLQAQIAKAQERTKDNKALVLNVAANYGGRWDILQAAKKLSVSVNSGAICADDYNEENLSKLLCMAEQPEVDLMIRTGGDYRISNFVLWQAAYAELIFTETLWPDFDKSAFHNALLTFGSRQRRFGLTGKQIDDLRQLS